MQKRDTAAKHCSQLHTDPSVSPLRSLKVKDALELVLLIELLTFETFNFMTGLDRELNG